jgi:hypothetical protein
MILLFLGAGVPLLVGVFVVGGFLRSLRSTTAAWRAVSVAAPLAAAAGVAYAVEFPSLVRQIRSSTAAPSYLALPLLTAIIAAMAFAVAWAAAFLVLDRRRALAPTAGSSRSGGRRARPRSTSAASMPWCRHRSPPPRNLVRRTPPTSGSSSWTCPSPRSSSARGRS